MFKYTDTKNFNFSYIKEKRIFERIREIVSDRVREGKGEE